MRGAVWIGALLLCAPLWAKAQGPAWQYTVTGQVKPGEKARLRLSSANGAHGVSLGLVSAAGQRKDFKIKSLKPGKVHELAFAVPPGRSEWTGRLVGSAEGSTGEAKLEFAVVSATPLDVQTDKAGVDLGAGRIAVRPTNPLSRAELQVFGAEGLLFDGEARLEEGPGGSVLVAFDPPEEGVKRVELKLHDEYGYWAALRVVAWYAEIAHEDVEFESGQAEVRPSEAPKIDRAITALQAEVARFRRELGDDAAGVEVKVYVGGYTDTVGAPADNRALSARRAEAIGRYFATHGVRAPIYVQGFGEDALAVATEDGVDEPRNRRAVYVLANVPPRGAGFPRAAWRRLK